MVFDYTVISEDDSLEKVIKQIIEECIDEYYAEKHNSVESVTKEILNVVQYFKEKEKKWKKLK